MVQLLLAAVTEDCKAYAKKAELQLLLEFISRVLVSIYIVTSTDCLVTNVFELVQYHQRSLVILWIGVQSFAFVEYW